MLDGTRSMFFSWTLARASQFVTSSSVSTLVGLSISVSCLAPTAFRVRRLVERRRRARTEDPEASTDSRRSEGTERALRALQPVTFRRL